VPFADEAEWRHWWPGAFQIINSVKVMTRPARMSEREKDRYTVAEISNIPAAAGITRLLLSVGPQNGRSTGFAPYLAFGDGGSSTVDAPGP
jgi:hypothetical protein